MRAPSDDLAMGLNTTLHVSIVVDNVVSKKTNIPSPLEVGVT